MLRDAVQYYVGLACTLNGKGDLAFESHLRKFIYDEEGLYPLSLQRLTKGGTVHLKFGKEDIIVSPKNVDLIFNVREVPGIVTKVDDDTVFIRAYLPNDVSVLRVPIALVPQSSLHYAALVSVGIGDSELQICGRDPSMHRLTKQERSIMKEIDAWIENLKVD